ncbi:MAG: FecR domain-containing protein [Deltaproteobacteria bacterium]|nr:FecR domain-containing protein [Deltaproteobacteria bacterium]
MRMLPILVMVVASLSAVSGWASPVEVGKAAAVAGKVEVRLPGEKEWTVLRTADSVFQGSTVKTGKESRARFLMTDKSVLMVDEQSEFEINDYSLTAERQSSLLTMFKGKMIAVVTKALTAGKSRYEIRTPTAVAGVRGTYLGLEVAEAEGRTELWVLSGKVNLKNLLERQGDGMDVAAGYMTSVMPGVAPVPAVPIDPEKMEKIRGFITNMRRPFFAGIQAAPDINGAVADALLRPNIQADARDADRGPVVSTGAAGAVLPPVRYEKSLRAEDVRVLIHITMPGADPAETARVLGK